MFLLTTPALHIRCIIELLERRILLEQLLRITNLHHLATRKDRNLVEIRNRRDSVRHGENGASPELILQQVGY